MKFFHLAAPALFPFRGRQLGRQAQERVQDVAHYWARAAPVYSRRLPGTGRSLVAGSARSVGL